jgi:hypothetical protein
VQRLGSTARLVDFDQYSFGGVCPPELLSPAIVGMNLYAFSMPCSDTPAPDVWKRYRLTSGATSYAAHLDLGVPSSDVEALASITPDRGGATFISDTFANAVRHAQTVSWRPSVRAHP